MGLTNEQQGDVRNNILTIKNSFLTVESLFELFNEWRSSQTKSVKRFFISLCFVLSVSVFAGVDITEIKLFGVVVHDNMKVVFLGVLLLVVIFSGIYFEFLRQRDFKIRNAKILRIEDHINQCRKAKNELHLVMEENGIRTIGALISNVSGSLNIPETRNTYDAILFYEEYLEKTRKRNRFVENVEWYSIYILFLFAAASIIFSYLK